MGPLGFSVWPLRAFWGGRGRVAENPDTARLLTGAGPCSAAGADFALRRLAGWRGALASVLACFPLRQRGLQALHLRSASAC